MKKLLSLFLVAVMITASMSGVVSAEQKGRVLGNANVGIADALEILKYLAGMDSKIEKGNDAWNAARITYKNTPDIGDVLEILKYLAGMENEIDAAEQRNALKRTKEILNVKLFTEAFSKQYISNEKYIENIKNNGYFSYAGLIEHLESEGFSRKAAVYAADNCGANWEWQAAQKARVYRELTPYAGGDAFVSQLMRDGFTYEQAVRGARSAGAWVIIS